MESSDDPWAVLNKARYDSLELLRILYGLPEPCWTRPPYQLLCGAAFCLWRSAFMFSAQPDWEESAHPARAVIKRLLDHNAIGYTEESTNRDWFVGFYLNSAELRIRLAARRLGLSDRELKSLLDHVDRFWTLGEEEARSTSWGETVPRWYQAYNAAVFIASRLAPAT